MSHKKPLKVIFLHTLLGSVLALLILTNVAESSGKKERGDGKALIGIGHHLIKRGEDASGPRWGYQISFILPGSAAFKGGLQMGDILLSWDGHTLDQVSTPRRSQALRNYLKQHKRVGEPLAIKFLRYSVQVGDTTPTTSSALKRQWLGYLQHPKVNQTQQINITYHAKVINRVITLGQRYDDIDLPQQADLLKTLLPINDEFDLAPPLYDLPQTLISTFSLSHDYADLLSRYETDQKWQQQFVNKRFRYLQRSPFDLLPMTENYTQSLWQHSQQDLLSLLSLLSGELGTSSGTHSRSVVALNKPTVPTSTKQQEHLDFIVEVLAQAHVARQQAFRLLTQKEQQQLVQELPQLLDRFAKSYYIHQDGGDALEINRQNQQLLSWLRKIDVRAFFIASEILLQLTDKRWLSQLQKNAPQWFDELRTKNQPANKSSMHKQSIGVIGGVIADINSTYGRIIIGSGENNIYTQPVAVIIDLGGNDKYYGANSPQHTPINIIVDSQGNDLYSSTVPYAQGATLLGVSLLFDFSGDDRYLAHYYGQGVAIGGVAVLYDEAGDDRYSGQRFAQGVGFWGVGVLHDKAGMDYYTAWRYAQGVGGVGGIGVLLDDRGDDHYHAVGESRSSYGTMGNFQSSSQGFGVGFRGYAPGGTGVLLDGGGTDYYEAGNFAQGVGYFFAVGILRDFGDDDDVYHASRYGIGASAHSAAGVFIEDGGNDRYAGNHIALIGSAWDLALAAFWDKQGDDTYRQTARGFSIGVAAHNGHSVFLDSAGEDSYRIEATQQQVPNNDYHGGSSFAFFIDAGGQKDRYYPWKFDNNSLLYEYNHAFMIDLPTPLTAQSQHQFWQILQNLQ